MGVGGEHSLAEVERKALCICGVGEIERKHCPGARLESAPFLGMGSLSRWD